MSNILVWSLVGFGLAVVFASFFEWTLHRFVMHRPVGPFRYPYEKHHLIHHRIFKADHTYHLVHEPDKHTIPMAWWNGPVLVALCEVPFFTAAYFSGQWGLVYGSFPTFIAYYAIYESIHWCMHLPRQRNVERTGLFFRLNGHHLLHHRYMHQNFNVVFPLADLCLGTLITRSKIRFKQATGPAVPDVQPKEPALAEEPVAK